MKTKTEIINETVAYYSENPLNKRSKNPLSGCHYSKQNKMCAVGRCLIDPDKIEKETNIALVNIKIESTSVKDLEKLFKNLDELFKEEYRGHDSDFWQALQNLHDYDYHWTDEGLSDRGKTEVQFLLDMYKGQ